MPPRRLRRGLVRFSPEASAPRWWRQRSFVHRDAVSPPALRRGMARFFARGFGAASMASAQFRARRGRLASPPAARNRPMSARGFSTASVPSAQFCARRRRLASPLAATDGPISARGFATASMSTSPSRARYGRRTNRSVSGDSSESITTAPAVGAHTPDFCLRRSIVTDRSTRRRSRRNPCGSRGAMCGGQDGSLTRSVLTPTLYCALVSLHLCCVLRSWGNASRNNILPYRQPHTATCRSHQPLRVALRPIKHLTCRSTNAPHFHRPLF